MEQVEKSVREFKEEQKNKRKVVKFCYLETLQPHSKQQSFMNHTHHKIHGTVHGKIHHQVIKHRFLGRNVIYTFDMSVQCSDDKAMKVKVNSEDKFES